MHDKFHDSAGVPWEGREFSQNNWSQDDGSTPAILAAVLDRELDKSALISALAECRLLIPLLAELGESGIGSHGQTVDKSADLAIVAVSTPDGKTAIPAFSSVAEMAAWNSTARPVPVDMAKLAIAAVSEGHDRVVLNPAGQAIGLRRPALAALAQGLTWTPPHLNDLVFEAVRLASENVYQIKAIALFDADPTGQLLKPELGLEITLAPGLSQQELQQVLTQFGTSLQTQEFLAMVDSFTIKVLAG
jgi:alkylhydroperoxidase family enzyme